MGGWRRLEVEDVIVRWMKGSRREREIRGEKEAKARWRATACENDD